MTVFLYTAGFFSNSIFDLDINTFDQSKIELNIEKTSNDSYLKLYNLKIDFLNSINKIDQENSLFLLLINPKSNKYRMNLS